MAVQLVVAVYHQLLREGLVSLLGINNIHVIGEADNGLSAVELVVSLKPDAVLMSIKMPKLDAIEAIRRIKCALPQVGILVLTSSNCERVAADALAAGADGCFDRIGGTADLMNAIDAVRAGRRYIGPGFNADAVLERIAASGLTQREHTVLESIVSGAPSPRVRGLA